MRGCSVLCAAASLGLDDSLGCSLITIVNQPTNHRTVTAEQEEDDDWGVVQKPVEQLYMGNRQAAELMCVWMVMDGWMDGCSRG